MKIDFPDQVAETLLARFGTLPAILSAEPAAIAAVSSGGTGDLCRLAHDLLMRVLRTDFADRPLLDNGAAVVAYLRTACGHSINEEAHTLFLNAKMLLVHELVSRGTIDEAPMYLRDIVRCALDVGATGLILAHNHPSGIAEPSRADKVLTMRLSELCKVFGIAVWDNIIVTRSGHFSFRDAGLL